MAAEPVRKLRVSPALWAEHQRGISVSNFIAANYPRTVKLGERASHDHRQKVVTAMALFGVAIEHHAALLKLIQQHMRTSAFALARPIYDAVLRGAWVAFLAAPEEIQRFKEGVDPNPDKILKLLKRDRADIHTLLADVKQNGWKILSSYVHSSHLQIDRWTSRDRIGAAHTDEEATEMLKLTTFLALTSMCLLAEVAGKPDDTIAEYVAQFMT